MNTMVGSISEGANMQQAVRSFQEAFNEYFPIPHLTAYRSLISPPRVQTLMCRQWSHSALTRLVLLKQGPATSKGG